MPQTTEEEPYDLLRPGQANDHMSQDEFACAVEPTKQTHYLKITSDNLDEQNSITIKQCHTLKQAFTQSAFDSEATQESNNHFSDINKHRSSLQQFVESSGFKKTHDAKGRPTPVKQTVGEEFKFVLNQYPDVVSHSRKISQTGTVKLKIYKVYERQAPISQQAQPVWKEVNVLEKLDFEVDDSQDGQQLVDNEQSDLLAMEQKQASSSMIYDQNGKWQASGEKNSLNMPQQDNPLSQLEMFHIELTGVCTDDDR